MVLRYYQIVVCDAEESFAIALTNYMNRSGQIPGLAMAFTEPEETLRYVREHTPDLILAGNGMEAVCREPITSPILWIGEEDRQSAEHTIARYSPASAYVRKALGLLSEESSPEAVGGSGCLCTAVYAPAGRCGKTTTAHALCREAARSASGDSRCIYLGWEEFGGRPEETGAMEELLYDIKLKKGNISMKMKALASSASGYDCILSAASYQELRELSREDIGWLLERVRREGYYRFLTADIGSGSLASLESLLEFDLVYVPCLQEAAMRNPLCAFSAAMKHMGLWERFREICYPLSPTVLEGTALEQLEEWRRSGGLRRLSDMEEELWTWNQSGYAKR